MYLQRVAVRRFRAAADDEMVWEFPGRFSALIGANNADKSTVADALYLAHPHSFPEISRPTVATLAAAAPRQIDIRYAFDTDVDADEGPVRQMLQNMACSRSSEARSSTTRTSPGYASCCVTPAPYSERR